ncbi:AbrB family transcriptional regulator [Citrobacter sp. EC_71]|uniref:AbrB family transcriptional regulator n=1 Tax=Citrobacter sp. EC_71 TaxID=2584093 RepID=UPI001C707773|nr:AbrB family transcriptional regulator [Citrobacter sp. EC_71]MBW9352001.1 AbrB family transcriptional regulator [Citrobacter sp. EC_71]
MRVLAGIILCFLVGQGFTFCNVPLGMMFGALFTVLMLKRIGFSVSSMPGSITVIQLSLGISIGIMFRDFSYGEHRQISLLFALLLLCLSLQFTLSYFWCVRRLGWNKEEALLGAVPGAMAAVLALASHIKTPPQKIVISHSLRLITLTFLAGYITRGASADILAATPAVFFSGHNLLWLTGMVLAGYIAGKFLERLHFPAPFMITSLVCAAALHPLSSQPLIFPDLFNQISMVLMGILLGHHFTTYSMTEFGRHLWSSVQLVLIGLGVTIIMAFISARLLDYPFPVLMLSWVPGSVESMSFAALALKADASFVMANHIIRMLLIHTVPALVFFRKRQMKVD